MNKLMTPSAVTDKKTNRLSEHRLIVAQSIVFFLLLVNAFRAGTVPDMVILGAAAVMPFFLKPAEIAAYIVGFAMMGTGVQVAYIAVACLASLLIRQNAKLKMLPLIATVVFAAAELAHMAVTAVSDDLADMLRYTVVYALLFFLLFTDYDTRDKVRVVNGYVYGTVVSVIHVFVETLQVFRGDLLRFTDGTFRFGYAEQLGTPLTMAADPNLVGQSCSFAIVFCLTLVMLGYRHKLYYVAMAITLLAGTLTISKTFLISMVLIVVLMIFFVGSWTSSKMWVRRLLLILLVALGCFVVAKLNPTYIENVFSRVDESDITTGRTTNALIYLQYLMNDALDLLLGVGMQNVGAKIGFAGSPHAALIEALICWGVVGTVLMLWLIVRAVRQHTASVTVKPLSFIPLIVFTVLVQSTQLFRLRDRLFALLVVILLAGIPQKGGTAHEPQEERPAGR